MVELKKITSDNVYDSIHGFVTKGEIIVEDYDAMIEVILSMIKTGYCFVMDRDLLRDAMESLTYMYAPSDDMNRDRILQQFADEDGDDDDDDDEDEEDSEFGNMDLMKMMQMMGGMGGPGGPDSGESCPNDTCGAGTCDDGTTCDAGEPVTDAVEPVTDAIEPVVEAVEPAVEAVEPVVEAVEPVVEPTDKTV